MKQNHALSANGHAEDHTPENSESSNEASNVVPISESNQRITTNKATDKRLSVPITPQMDEGLKLAAKRRGISSSGKAAKSLLRKALFLESLVKDKNAKIMIEDENNQRGYIFWEDDF